MEYLIALLVGIYVGWQASSLFHRYIMGLLFEKMGYNREKLMELNSQLEREIAEGEDKTPPQHVKERIEVIVEKDQDVLYAYNKATHQFLGQSTDSQQIMKLLADKFKDKGTVVIVEGGEHIVA